MSLHPQRSWTYQSTTEPQAFVPPEHNLKRHASIPAFSVPQLHPSNNGQLLNPSRFQPRGFPSHPPAFNVPYFPNGPMPPNRYGQPPAPVVPINLPPSLATGKPKLPKKPTPGGLGLYKIEDTPRPPLKEEEVPTDDETPAHNIATRRSQHSSQGDVVPDEAMEKVQLQLADKLWLEEQERQKQQVEEERKRYERDLANGVSQRPLVPRPSSNFTDGSEHNSRQSHPPQHPSHHPQPAPQPQHQHVNPRHQQAIVPTTLLPPNQPLQPRPISTEEREHAKHQALRTVMEEHTRAQERARKEAEYAAQRKAEMEAEMQRQERERKERAKQEAEAQRLKEQQEREKFEEECRRVSELQDATMKKNAEQEAIQREYMRRAEAKRWQYKREKEERRQSRQRRRDYERRWQEDAWARSYANPPHLYNQPRRYPAFPPYIGPEDRVALEQAIMHRPNGRRVQSENDPIEQHAHISEIDDSGDSIKLDGEEEANRITAAWQRYDSLWNVFVKQPPAPNSLRFRDIPWPTVYTHPTSLTTSPRTIGTMLNPSTIAKFIFSPHHSQGKSNRQRLRSTFVRFQPERSTQWLALVKESERPAVMMGIDIVFRTLADLMEKESMSRSAIAGGEHN